jgi:hypothetical protein
MPRGKKFTAEQIIGKLREPEAALGGRRTHNAILREAASGCRKRAQLNF